MTFASGLVRGAGVWALLAASSMLYGCSSGIAAPQDGLPVVEACFVSASGVVPVKLEIASTSEQRQKGLMGRTSMAADAGMLFKYREPRSASHGFWMYKTLIPLDIAYLSEDGKIGSIRKMVPCPSASGSGCPTYPAGVPFIQAVEMNAGFYREYGIRPGDHLYLGKENCPAR
ncbi:hypothetical protein SAMN04487881_2437 [Marinobacter sp. es.048]|uniref:DUF192 domain-containing protein n=1 Tax=Marinobacter sp. es.048 TaxID=1761795 RepID=UPI000B6D5FB1|nr:DUF192 domain-containing protein [Marinobacter sp. es.048]SNC74551.1 hypothetical protein SAMN04487881_2437 [Marinobacter sp. es.048]